MVYTIEDARAKFKPGQGDLPPSIALTGVKQYQSVIIQVAQKYCPDILDASTGLSKGEIPVECTPEPNNSYDDAAIRAEVVGFGTVGYLPRHASAFYFDDLTEKAGGIQRVDGCIATAGQENFGFRIYGSAPNSPLGTFPGDMGWEWVVLDHANDVGYWSKDGEARPRHRVPS